MYFPDPSIKPMRAVCLMNVWDSWTVSDVGRIIVWDDDDLFSRRGAVRGVYVSDHSKTAHESGVPSAQKNKSLDVVTRHSHLRMEKISAIRAAIADGSYSVSAEDLAEKLIAVLHGNYR